MHLRIQMSKYEHDKNSFKTKTACRARENNSPDQQVLIQRKMCPIPTFAETKDARNYVG